MKAPKDEESDLVGDLTDKAITNRINALERGIATRENNKLEIDAEIFTMETEHDALVDEQMKRLTARKTRKPEKQDADSTV